MAARNEKLAAEKRRVILDAAVRVFAQQGFNQCRVSDIADEAGVAYGLVYHYFRSKDEVLDTLFLERWNVMLDVIRELDGQDLAPREKLYAIASFIVDSYSHDPDLMKVIIVEVTRAANSFGQTHLQKITEAYELIAGIVERAQADGVFKDTVTPRFAALAFYGAIEQVLSGWIFETLPRGPLAIGRTYGDPALLQRLAGAIRRRITTAIEADLGYGDPRGSFDLRKQLAAHLAASRGILCDPACVLITSGTQQGLRLCIDSLLKPGDTVWMEDPGYPTSRRTAEHGHARRAGRRRCGRF